MNKLKALLIGISISVLFLGCKDSLINSSNQSSSEIPNPSLSVVSSNSDKEGIIEGRYIVVFKDQDSELPNELAAENARNRISEIQNNLNIPDQSIIHRYNYALKGFTGDFNDSLATKLENHPLVDYVAPDIRFKGIMSANQAVQHNLLAMVKSWVLNLFTSQSGTINNWGLDRVGGSFNGATKIDNRAWIMDSGIDLDHPDLNVDLNLARNFLDSSVSANDDLGHGTYVAGILAAKSNTEGITGVAAGLSVVPLKVCQNDDCEASAMIKAADFAKANFTSGDVMNISIGGKTTSFTPETVDALEFAIKDASDEGLKTVIAAGNKKDDANDYTPARLNGVWLWTVSAFEEGDTFAVDFPDLIFQGSNFGNPPIDFSAPGVDVPSLRIGGGAGFGWDPVNPGSDEGTSFAAPHVAGLLVTSEEIGTDGFVTSDPDNNPDPIAFNGAKLSAPTVTASVSGGRPRLDWDMVFGADAYDVYRRFDTQEWHLYFDDVTDTFMVDYSQQSDNMTVSGSHFGGNKITYAVRAVGFNKKDSNNSNLVYFDTGSSSGGGDGGPSPIGDDDDCGTIDDPCQ